MRVVIATDCFAALSSSQAGAAMGLAWAEAGAQVAVVPVGVAGAGLSTALADLWAGSVQLLQVGDQPVEVVLAGSPVKLVVSVPVARVPGNSVSSNSVSGPGAGASVSGASSTPAERLAGSSRVVGDAVSAALDLARGAIEEVVLEVGAVAWHDGGAGMLAALGASGDVPLDEGCAALEGLHDLDLARCAERLGGARLTLAVPADEVTAPLVGLRGLTSRLASEAPGLLPPERMLRLDQNLVDLARVAGPDAPAEAPGAGARGGLGWAVQALGGQVLSGPRACAEQAGLVRTIAQADLVVTGGDRLDFGTMGGDVLTEVRTMAADALRPLVVVAGENFISARELRSIGVEAAYPVRPAGRDSQPGPVTAAELTAATRPVAASWTW